MTCLDCGKGTLTLKEETGYGGDGAPVRDEWWECGYCGAKFTDEDLARAFQPDGPPWGAPP